MIRMGRTKRPKRKTMAAEREVQNDYRAHSRDYSGFVKLMKWGTILSLITGALVVVMISS